MDAFHKLAIQNNYSATRSSGQAEAQAQSRMQGFHTEQSPTANTPTGPLQPTTDTIIPPMDASTASDLGRRSMPLLLFSSFSVNQGHVSPLLSYPYRSVRSSTTTDPWAYGDDDGDDEERDDGDEDDFNMEQDTTGKTGFVGSYPTFSFSSSSDEEDAEDRVEGYDVFGDPHTPTPPPSSKRQGLPWHPNAGALLIQTTPLNLPQAKRRKAAGDPGSERGNSQEAAEDHGEEEDSLHVSSDEKDVFGYRLRWLNRSIRFQNLKNALSRGAILIVAGVLIDFAYCAWSFCLTYLAKPRHKSHDVSLDRVIFCWMFSTAACAAVLASICLVFFYRTCFWGAMSIRTGKGYGYVRQDMLQPLRRRKSLPLPCDFDVTVSLATGGFAVWRLLFASNTSPFLSLTGFCTGCVVVVAMWI